MWVNGWHFSYGRNRFFLPAYDHSPAKIIYKDHTRVRHSQDSYGGSQDRETLQVFHRAHQIRHETNTPYPKSCTHLTKGTRPNTIRHADWIGDLGRAADNCFIFDLVTFNSVTCLLDSNPL